jgi:hypothetical protein
VVDGIVIIKTKADVAAVVVGADSDNKAGTVISALTITATLVSTAELNSAEFRKKYYEL